MLTDSQLKAYLKFFKDDKNVFFEPTGWYIKYHDEVENFISDCYESDMMDTKYLANLENYLDKDIRPK